jgi:methionyl-tRNA formyltransferase
VSALRLVLLGDGEWAARSLERLQATPHDVIAVLQRVRPTDSSLADAARRFGIPVHAPARVNAPEVGRMLATFAPGLLVSIAYDQILGAPARTAARHGALNFHAGKLPHYRGRNVINWALINGETEIGITAHFMDDGIDTGDILLQRTLPLTWTDTYGSVLGRVVAALPDLVVAGVDLVASGRFDVHSQRELPGSYFGARREGDEWLDWSDGSAALHNKIRAITHPGPGARTIAGGVPVIIWRAFADPAAPHYRAIPGQVVGRGAGGGALVKTGDSTLLVEEVQLEGAAPAAPSWPVGTRLGVDPVAVAHAAAIERIHPTVGPT